MKPTTYLGHPGTLAFVFVLALGTSVGGQAVRVDGWVYDSSRKPLVGVHVSGDQGGKITVAKDTAADGHYELTLPDNASITKVSYTRTDLEPGVVAHLSGQRNHSISKVLYKPGEPRSMEAHIEQLAAYEHLLLAAQSGQDQVRTLVLQLAGSQYLEKLPVEKIEIVTVRTVLQGHKDLLVKAYKEFAQGGRGRGQ